MYNIGDIVILHESFFDERPGFPLDRNRFEIINSGYDDKHEMYYEIRTVDDPSDPRFFLQ